ncbi:MAG: glycosyltransferase family 4 protein [Crocinitomicaceae bacterium]|nr:glycosyltransferase family 4 protein [Crocinitomicaceae bacterium]
MLIVKVAFLYTEVAGYFLACAQELSKSAEVLIFRWPVNKEAPFDLSSYSNLTLLDRTDYSQQELEEKLHEFDPSAIICSGWMDKGYTRAAKTFNKKIPVVVTMDNHWTGSIKQHLATMTAPFHLKKVFTHAWVPGKPQAMFAERLGFTGEHLLRNFYCADANLFNEQFKRTFPTKKDRFPRRFLYVARYVEHKGIFEMWQAFSELQEEEETDWELWCLGTGDEWDNKMEHDKIKHIGFVQPTELEQYVAQTGVYILPSKFEPWGVSVQEFAICGFPLLLSNKIGAKWTYLKDGINGFEFQAGSVKAIKEKMKEVMRMTDEELVRMGEKSHEIGMSFTPEHWVENLLSILK